MTAGFRVFERKRRASVSLVEAFAALPVANVGDCMNRMSAGGSTLRPLHRGGTMAGSALTVRTRPGDNLMVHKALSMAGPGDVIVVDAGGDLTTAIIGELMVLQAQELGVAGFVINGAVRDAAAIGNGSLPVYAAGITLRGPYKDGPGEVNVPISIGGMVIEPGDVIVGDADGVLYVPCDDAESILAAARAKAQAEAKQIELIRSRRNDLRWIDTILRQRGCALPDTADGE